jgi:hypothetical protein
MAKVSGDLFYRDESIRTVYAKTTFNRQIFTIFLLCLCIVLVLLLRSITDGKLVSSVPLFPFLLINLGDYTFTAGGIDAQYCRFTVHHLPLPRLSAMEKAKIE